MAKKNAKKTVMSIRSKSQSTSHYGTFGNKTNIGVSNNAYDNAENETSLNDVLPKTNSSIQI